MTATYTPYYEGGHDLLHAEFIQRELHRRAELGKAFAEAVAPIDLNGTTQHYKESFTVINTPRTDRACVTLRNDDDDAFFVEFGTGIDQPRPQGGSSPRHRVMGRASDIMSAG